MEPKEQMALSASPFLKEAKNSNNQPLLVLDGTIVSTIDDIQPTQVKSVEVLKGASASIYGSRGANGVILIHLKGTSDRK